MGTIKTNKKKLLTRPIANIPLTVHFKLIFESLRIKQTSKYLNIMRKMVLVLEKRHENLLALCTGRAY